MLSLEIGQRESGFYSERTDRITESCQHPVPYYNIDIYRNKDLIILDDGSLYELDLKMLFPSST